MYRNRAACKADKTEFYEQSDSGCRKAGPLVDLSRTTLYDFESAIIGH